MTTKFDKWVTKKNSLLVLGLLLLLIFAAALWISETQLCGYSDESICAKTLLTFEGSGILILPAFVICLILCKMRDEIFRAWIRFAIWWVPLSIIIIGTASTDAQSYIFPSSQSLLGLLLPFLFVIISLIIIIYKWANLQKKRS